MVHPIWAMSTQKLPALFYYTIQQNEGIQPAATPLHFLFTLAVSLTQSQRLFTMLQYNTHPYYNAFILQGNYHGKILRVTQYHGSVNCWTTNIQKIISGASPLKFLS